MRDLSIGIVSYNSENELCCALDSLKNTVGVDFRLTVIDNHSSDGSISLAQAADPDCKVIRLRKNIGFGAANNIAIRESDARYHLIANPDVAFAPQLLMRCVAFMDANPDVAIMTPKLLNPDGSEQFTPKKKPSLPCLMAGFLETRTGKIMRLRSEYTLRGQRIAAPKEIDFCAGCFMLCRTAMLKACGGFDEHFFLYFEDADLTLRMQRYGRTVYNPALSVTHMWQRDNHTLKGIAHELASLIRFLWKWRKFSPKESDRRA